MTTLTHISGLGICAVLISIQGAVAFTLGVMCFISESRFNSKHRLAEGWNKLREQGELVALPGIEPGFGD